MKILIPTDFSIYADYAIQMALNISKYKDLEIHLLHVVTPLNRLAAVGLNTKLRSDLIGHLKDWATEKLKRNADHIKEFNIPCKTKIVSGKYLDSIKASAEIENYNLIIMGSHGASGKEEWFIGSNASKTIRKLHNNILVVKQKPKDFDSSEVVYVTGLDTREQNSFKAFLNLTDALPIKKIHILTVDTLSYFSQPTSVMNEALEDFKLIAFDKDVETHFYTDFSIHAGIRHFSEEYKISLIGMSNYLRHPLKRMFQGSNVEMTVNHSQIPVLSIDFE